MAPTRRVVPAYQRFPADQIVGEMTVDEWLVLLETSLEKLDYVNGVVVRREGGAAVAGGSYEHAVICTDVASAISAACQAVGSGCDAINSELKVFIRPDLYYFPDVSVVCGAPQLDTSDSLRNPVALVEVLSPSTETSDRADKFRDYQKIASFRQYVLVEQTRPRVTHYAKQENGLWAIAGDHEGLEDQLTLTLNDATISVPLSAFYRRVNFEAAPVAAESV